MTAIARPLSQRPLHFIGDIKREIRSKAGHAACSSKFYHWLLSSGDAPTQMAVRMIDPWPGDADAGRAICRGHYTQNGANIRFTADNAAHFWRESEAHDAWVAQIHEFGFLRDLRAAGGEQSRRIARALVDCWIDVYDRWDAEIWRADTMGQRIATWLAFYDYFCGSADEEFQQRYYTSITKQARHLSRALSNRGNLNGIALLKAAKGLVFAGLAFPGREAWILQGFEIILDELPNQILSDGGHVSRSPKAISDALQIVLELRCALNRAGLPVPEVIQHAIDRAGQAIRFFRYADKKLGLFHGGQEGDSVLMDALQLQAGAANKALKALPETGFERVQMGRSLLMLDTAPIGDALHMHSSPLSFEFAYGKERIFVNCGGHPNINEWQQVLRHTAAHTALTLDGKPAHDFKADGHIARRHKAISCKRTENRESCLIEAEHHAYVSLNGIAHSRRLYLCDQGLDLRGEDTLIAEVPSTHAMPIAIRFHLHPRVLVNYIHNRDEAILQLPGGASWRFYAVGGKLDVENSIYLGFGAKPQKCKQLVITSEAKAEKTQIKWALQKEK